MPNIFQVEEREPLSFASYFLKNSAIRLSPATLTPGANPTETRPSARVSSLTGDTLITPAQGPTTEQPKHEIN